MENMPYSCSLHAIMPLGLHIKTDNDIQNIATDEDGRWKTVHKTIIEEALRARADQHDNSKLAMSLTSEIVNSTRDEDRAALASDEAVAHGLTSLRKNIATEYEGLARQPYFARVVTREGDKSVEFRLGTASFPSQRIVDWRRAPISQLYYSYKQDEEFDEIIQGRERSGKIILRRGYQGIDDSLKSIELPEGNISRQGDKWIFDSQDEVMSRAPGHDGHLPPILSLITEEQFGLITHEAKRPVVIQGIAGSGKTTVALHRLAWLLHEDNSDASPQNCLVMVFNRALKSYIETTLPELGIEGIAIKTYHQWLMTLLGDIVGHRDYGSFHKIREAEIFKSSPDCLKLIRKYVNEYTDIPTGGYMEDLHRFFRYLGEREIFWPKWQSVSDQLKKQAGEKLHDQQDDTILANLIYTREGTYKCKGSGLHNLCDHIVIDEAQDFGVMEICAILGALDADRTVTIVGDECQKIISNRHFEGWEILLKEAGFSDTQPISLTVSHRTTQEIMDIAAFVRGNTFISHDGSRAIRHGPTPTVIKTDSFEVQPNMIGRWMEARLREDPRSLSAIICRWPKQAERLAEVLKKEGYSFVKWAHRDNFDFSPGVIVTNVHQVKGLEFRNVLIVNPTEAQYSPVNDEDRNLLYVAITRAEQKLDFICCGKPTLLLPQMHKGS